jgi:hypothetical protein
MTSRLIKYALAAALVGTCCAGSTVSFAQEFGVEVGPAGVYAGVNPNVGPYGAYGYDYPGPRFGYRGGTHAIYGGPSSNLFSYEGPNRGAMERVTH